MKTRYFLLSALAAAAIMPGTASAKLLLDIPPILAGQNKCAAYSGCPDGPCYPDCKDPCVECNPTCQNFANCPDGPCYPNCTDPCDSATCSSSSSPFNDTGITTSQVSDDDAQYGRDKAAADGTLTKIGSGHAGFDFSAVSGNCVQDNATGLLWSPDQGSAMTYTTAESKADDANTNSLCGQSSGWRIPNLRELLSLVSYGAESYNAGKTIDSTFFSDTQVNPSSSTALWYWTATLYPPDNDYKWGVSFQPKYNTTTDSPSVNYININGLNYLRLVNGPEMTGSFNVDTDGNVHDSSTGLTWKRCLEGQSLSGDDCINTATPYTWANALALTANGWRLPNIKELQSTINGSTYFPAPTADTYVWSSSPYAGNTNNIWVINVKDGTFWNSLPKTTDNFVRVRLVKDAQ